MKVFIVYAHPESRSYNGSFLTATIEHLKKNGHEVRVSDLYKEHFKSVVDGDDFLNFHKGDRLKVIVQSKLATLEGKLTPDVNKAQENLLWADLVIFQFPFWWYNMPAIMRGWFERVYSNRFGYSVGPYSDDHPGSVYGEGKMEGKKAIIATTVGGDKEYYGPRSINGTMDDLLYPITHNMLFYTGFEVLPSHVTYEVDKADEENFNNSTKKFFNTLDHIDEIKPIPFRKQNFGDYELPACHLKEGKEKPGASGFALHYSE